MDTPNPAHFYISFDVIHEDGSDFSASMVCQMLS